MKRINTLSLEQADRIGENVVKCIKRNQFQPITVHVLDTEGHQISSKRMDGCSSIGIPDFALAKALTCLAMKISSRQFRDKYVVMNQSNNQYDATKFCQMNSMVSITQGKMAPFPGGVLIKQDNQIVGAVGVSGAAGDEDEYCAIRGVIESGYPFTTVPEQHSCSTIKDIL